MSRDDLRESIGGLIRQGEREIARLSQASAIEPRSELMHRVWPTVLGLAEAMLLVLEDDSEDVIAVDLVARTVGLILGMAQLLDKTLPSEQMNEIAARVREVVDELVSLVDEEELSAYVAAAVRAVEPHVATTEPVQAAAGEASTEGAG